MEFVMGVVFFTVIPWSSTLNTDTKFSNFFRFIILIDDF